MKRIIGIFKPFAPYQRIVVYDGNDKLEEMSVTFKDVPNTVFGFIEKYDLKQVDLSGPKQFIRGLKQDFEKEEMKKYNKSFIEFKII